MTASCLLILSYVRRSQQGLQSGFTVHLEATWPPSVAGLLCVGQSKFSLTGCSIWAALVQSDTGRTGLQARQPLSVPSTQSPTTASKSVQKLQTAADRQRPAKQAQVGSESCLGNETATYLDGSHVPPGQCTQCSRFRHTCFVDSSTEVHQLAKHQHFKQDHRNWVKKPATSRLARVV